MTDTNGTALLTGPKDRRAEFAITREMDEAVKILMSAGPWSRSDACRIIMARGIKQWPNLTQDAIEAARVSRERDAKLAQVVKDFGEVSRERDATDQAQRKE